MAPPAAQGPRGPAEALAARLWGMLRRAEISTLGQAAVPSREALAAGVITASNWAVSVLSCMGEWYLLPRWVSLQVPLQPPSGLRAIGCACLHSRCSPDLCAAADGPC